MENQGLSIKVPEQEFRSLIDRDKVVGDIKEHLSPWTALVQDLTNCGSNLIPRVFVSSERGLKDVVVIAILLRQVVAMLDGVDLLLRNGATHVAALQTRSMFEASLYIDWILQGNAEEKADYYYVQNLRRKRDWALRTQPNTPEAQAFIAKTNKIGIPISDELRNASKEQLQNINVILAMPKFASINAVFSAAKKPKRPDVQWYVHLGQPSVGAIAAAVGRSAEYVILYSGGSEVMHSSSYDQHVKFGKGQVTFEPIRSLEDFERVFRFSSTCALHTYRRILEEYRTGELIAFSKKYAEKWRKEFINFPKITVKPETTTI